MACTQVDTERRYAAALHQAVKRLMDPLAPELNALLAPAPPQGAPDPLAPVRTPRQLRPGSAACPSMEPGEDLAARCGPLKAALRGHLGALQPQLDARVLRRAAREAWNCVGAVRPYHPCRQLRALLVCGVSTAACLHVHEPSEKGPGESFGACSAGLCT